MYGAMVLMYQQLTLSTPYFALVLYSLPFSSFSILLLSFMDVIKMWTSSLYIPLDMVT